MKKLALSSLIAVFAVSGAHAANVIDGNPLYMPKANHFYSVTDLGSHTEGTPYGLGEEFGYGITDKFAVEVAATVTENDAFDTYAWQDLSLAGVFRALDMGEWKVDLVGAYVVDTLFTHPKIGTRDAWFDKDNTGYTWVAGVRGGYTTSQFTVAGKALFEYWNEESFNWSEERGNQGIHALVLGLDGQFVIDNSWNLTAGVEYTGFLDKEWYGIPGLEVKNDGVWGGTFGVNYNIDSTKFVGAYINGSLNHHEGNNRDEWGWNDGFGYGVKFGIDF